MMAGRTKLRVDDVRIAVQVAMRVRRREMLFARYCHRPAWARQVVMAIAHEFGCGTSAEIARVFRFDRTHVRNAKRRMRQRVEASLSCQQDIDGLRLSLLVYKAQIEQAEWPWPNYPARPRLPSPFTDEPVPPEAFVIGVPVPSAFARAA